MNEQEILFQLKKNDAFDTMAWQGRKEESKIFVKKLVEIVPEEMIKKIIKVSNSQKPEAINFIVLDSGELYAGMLQYSSIKTHLNVTLDELPACEYATIIFETNKPLNFEFFFNELNKRSQLKSWSFATIYSKKEMISAITFHKKTGKNNN